VTEGLLQDLSHGGAGILLPEGTRSVVPGVCCECAIELTDAVWLYCSVELCHMSSCRYPDRQLVGARFGALSPAQARLIGQCISALERELIRKRAAAL
jgi:c-di-GMP-binding flagellar brake protein YcgR